MPCLRPRQLRGRAVESLRGHRGDFDPDLGRGDRVVRDQRRAVGAPTSKSVARVVAAGTSDRGLPALHRDRARRRDLPVVHRRPCARGCASPDRCGTQVITWPFDWTVYVGLVALYFGHAWLARGSPDAQRKHTLYLLARLVTIWVALETPIDTISDHYLDSVPMRQHVPLACG